MSKLKTIFVCAISKKKFEQYQRAKEQARARARFMMVANVASAGK